VGVSVRARVRGRERRRMWRARVGERIDPSECTSEGRLMETMFDGKRVGELAWSKKIIRFANTGVMGMREQCRRRKITRELGRSCRNTYHGDIAGVDALLSSSVLVQRFGRSYVSQVLGGPGVSRPWSMPPPYVAARNKLAKPPSSTRSTTPTQQNIYRA